MTLKQHRKTILYTVLAFITVPTALVYTNYAVSNQPEPVRQEQAVPAPRVTVLPVTAATYRSRIQAFGEVQATDQISLKTEVSGKVIWRNPAFVSGGLIQKDAELIRIDPTGYKARLASARQTLAEARLALQQEQRQKEQALQDWKRAGISEKPGPLLLREPQLAAASARHSAAQAAVNEARRNLAQTRIKAPADSLITERLTATGSYLNQGDTVASLQTSSRAEVRLALSASQWQQLPADPRGEAVELFSRDLPGVRWQGQVTRLSHNIDANTRLRTLTVSVEQPLSQQQPLLFGSFVQAQLKGQATPDLFALPATALTADGYLWYVTGNTLERAARSVLFSHGDMLYVSRGELPEQISLVRKPVSGYLAGMKVQPVGDESVTGTLASVSGERQP